jgi:hypothetical protein
MAGAPAAAAAKMLRRLMTVAFQSFRRDKRASKANENKALIFGKLLTGTKPPWRKNCLGFNLDQQIVQEQSCL